MNTSHTGDPGLGTPTQSPALPGRTREALSASRKGPENESGKNESGK